MKHCFSFLISHVECSDLKAIWSTLLVIYLKEIFPCSAAHYTHNIASSGQHLIQVPKWWLVFFHSQHSYDVPTARRKRSNICQIKNSECSISKLCSLNFRMDTWSLME